MGGWQHDRKYDKPEHTSRTSKREQVRRRKLHQRINFDISSQQDLDTSLLLCRLSPFPGEGINES